MDVPPGVPSPLHHPGRVGPACLPGLAGAAVAARLERGDSLVSPGGKFQLQHKFY